MDSTAASALLNTESVSVVWRWTPPPVEYLTVLVVYTFKCCSRHWLNECHIIVPPVHSFYYQQCQRRPTDVKYLLGRHKQWRLAANSKPHWFTTSSFLQPLPYLVTPQGPENCQLSNKQFFVGAQTVVSLLQTTQIRSHVCFITDHVAYASSNKTKTVWIETELFFFYSGWMRLMFMCLLGR